MTIEAPDSPKPTPAQVTIVDVNMTIGDMMVFMIKWAIAAIPAAIVLAVLFALVVGILGAGIIGTR
jgi:hypothetical protein